MAIYLGSTALNNFRVGTVTPDRIFLGNDLVWPAFTETNQEIINVGGFTFNIPLNCRFIDIVMVGAGGGGQASAALFNMGDAGDPGQWAGITLKRGVDVPWGSLVITGSVPAGGFGGPGPSISPGGPGGTATATIDGVGTLQAPGGAAGALWTSDTRGQGPGNFTWNGKLYVGGGITGTGRNGPTGNAPGGGGAGSTGFGGGGSGAPGRVWIRCY
ncbi:hypothetical protein SEA_CHANGELING_8 [Mycobacterium phage Changeling]|nr:hypothetical protein SEA_CHANGELING_8 [Mycobacterium phage Changeling]